MPQTVIAYTDYKSPYAYLAKDPTYQLADELGVTVDWRPFVLDIPAAFGGVDERSEAQWRKVKYLYQDVRRFANKRGLRVLGPQKVFDSAIAAIGMLYAQRAGCFRAYNDIVFKRFFLRDLDIEQTDLIKGVLETAGADTSGFDDFLESEGPAQLDRIQNEALQQGVFGVPSFVVDGELFWGHDRVEWVRERLNGDGVFVTTT